MRTPALQYLYLQKPVTMVIIICIISVLPWIGLGDFSTKGEPREASVAISMLESGNWILPQVYADEFAYKPPLCHWLMAAASYPQGYVSEFTARLPSAVAFTVMIGFILVFFGKRFRFQEAFIATLFLITSVELHRAAMTTRVDMILTSLIVIGLIQLYRWEEKLELKGLPVVIPILLGCAALAKGPVGIVLPLFVFGVYLLLLRKYKFITIFKVVAYAFISSLFLPALWYIAAWKQGGDNFLNVMLAENFGRFFHLDTPEIAYDLGHQEGFFYNFLTLSAGFIPWTIFFVFSLFGMKLALPRQSLKATVRNIWTRFCAMDKPRLFSLVAIVCILFFYSIPSSKRSVYLMPAYPFIALFLAQYAIYVTEYRMRVTRVFAAFLASVVSVICIAIILTATGIIDPVAVAGHFIHKAKDLAQADMIGNAFSHPSALTTGIVLIVLIALGTVFYQMGKKINLKILYATIALTFTINLLIDGVVMKSIRKGTSCKPFAEYLQNNYPLTNDNVYTINNLKKYTNIYGLNFYMGNKFHNFDTDKPEKGFFITGESYLPQLMEEYSNYKFTVLTTSGNNLNEIKQEIVLTSFEKK